MNTPPPSVPPELAGFEPGGYHDPFEIFTGPFFWKQDGERYVSAFVGAEKHHNGMGTLHGGMLMTFADYAAFVIARDELENGTDAVTVTCYCDFLQGCDARGKAVYAKGEVTRATRGFIFLRGEIECEGERLATFSATLKKLKPRK